MLVVVAMVMRIGSLALLFAILCSTVLEPDLDLTIRETNGKSEFCLPLDRYVLVVEKLLLQLNLLELSVDDPVFVLRTCLT